MSMPTLLARLKELRLYLARSHQVPAYVVFPDTTLIEMARVRPASLDQMRQISGVGPRKLEQFGALFLEVTRPEDHEAVAQKAAGFDRA